MIVILIIIVKLTVFVIVIVILIVNVIVIILGGIFFRVFDDLGEKHEKFEITSATFFILFDTINPKINLLPPARNYIQERPAQIYANCVHYTV